MEETLGGFANASIGASFVLDVNVLADRMFSLTPRIAKCTNWAILLVTATCLRIHLL